VQLRHVLPVVFVFALALLTSIPATAATPLMRGLYVPAVYHIPAFTPVSNPFPKLAESAITDSINYDSREKRDAKEKRRGYQEALGKRAKLALGV
jgi:hypothetical protein